MELVLFLAVVYLFTFLIGRELELLRIPWVFAALILGLVFAFVNPFPGSTESEAFTFLAELGMYFFVFVIGFEIDIDAIRGKSWFLVKTATFIILVETVLGGVFIHYVFGTGWLIAFYVAHFFATVGEAVLLPILEEFELFDTDLGQSIVGVGVVDDVFEILSVLLLPFVISYGGMTGTGHINVVTAVTALLAMFGLAYLFMRMHRSQMLKFGDSGVEEGALFLFILFIVLLFVWIGGFAHAEVLGALLAGVAANNFLPRDRLDVIETEVKAVTFGFFGPLFFFWVGSDISIVLPSSLETFWGLPPLIIFVLLVLGKLLYVNIAKIGSILVVTRDRFDLRERLIMGLALTVKFSTSIVLIKIMFEEGVIGDALYSVLITSKIGFQFIVPLLLAWLIPRWGITTSGRRFKRDGSV